MFDFSGRNVVITGASGGIGRALCSAFGQAGARVIGCDLSKDGKPDICADYHTFDLCDGAAIDSAAQAICDAQEPHILISNAGWTRAESLDGITPEVMDHEMARNFGGAQRLSAALLPAMRAAAGDRNFVFISSVNAQAHFGNPTYAAAKAASEAWVRALATEMGPHGIRANTVVPASVRTAAWEVRLKTDPKILDRMSRLFPLGRIVTTQEVANAVLFLASPLASGITGASLNVDAGLMAGNLPFVEAINNLEQ